MAIRSIPQAFEYTCDFCKAVHLQENAIAMYFNGRPAEWVKLIIFVDRTLDSERRGVPEGAADTLLLCRACGCSALAGLDR